MRQVGEMLVEDRFYDQCFIKIDPRQPMLKIVGRAAVHTFEVSRDGVKFVGPLEPGYQ